MDSNEPTAWEEINPTTALAPQHGQPLTYSALTPATNVEFRNELTACLALVAPVGMTEEARRDWLAVAWQTLGHLPADLLSLGCTEARKTCDHPAKLVPAIIKATEDSMAFRRRCEREADHDATPRLRYEYTQIPHEETQRIIKEAFNRA